MFKTILGLLPAVVNLVTKLFSKEPPKRADEILGDANTPTAAEKAQDEARKRAAEKYGA